MQQLDAFSDAIIKFTEEEVTALTPTKLYICFDGTPSIMKVLRQDNEWRNTYITKQVKVKPMTSFPGPIISRQEIKPGTELIKHVSERLKADIELKKASGKWIDLMVTISDSGVCGEGEHKLVFDLKMDGCEDNEKYAICSEDTDCAYLALQTHAEDLVVYNRVFGTTSRQLQKLELSDMREAAWTLLNTNDKSSVGGGRQLDDFCFIAIPHGNDYLIKPTNISLEIMNSRLCYKGNDGEYLTRFGRIDPKNFYNFLSHLTELEYGLIGPGKATGKKRKEDGDLIWNQFRDDYYLMHNVSLEDVPFYAKNYLKVWISISHMYNRGSSDWEGLHCPKFTPLVADMLPYCFEALSEMDIDEGWHLTHLAYNILTTSSICHHHFSPTCVDPFPSEYKKLNSTKEIRKIFDEMENQKIQPKGDVTSILDVLRRRGFAITIKAKENSKSLCFPAHGHISKNMIQSHEYVQSTLQEASLRPFKYTHWADDTEEWKRRIERVYGK